MRNTDHSGGKGLCEREVALSRATYGANRYTKRKRPGFWSFFAKNLRDPVIRILLIALGLHILLLFRDPDWVETAGIAISVVLATLISTFSEYRSENAFARLFESCGAEKCRVRREGRVQELEVTELVVGDVVLLGAGEKIPADGVVFCGFFTVDQSPLTGESCEVEKRVYKSGEKEGPACPGSLLAGCAVLSGVGEMRVTRVGDATFLGGISEQLQKGGEDSPLKRRLAHLARQISRIGYLAAAVCALAFLFHEIVMENDFQVAQMLIRMQNLPYMASLLLRALTLALTVVVVAVPEGLPMMIAVVLGANMRRMVKDQVLVRKPEGIEAAGCMNILFTDKTGTLTVGSPSLCGVLCATGSFSHVRVLHREAPLLYERICLAAHATCAATRGVREGRAAVLGGNATDRAMLSAFLDAPFLHVERVESIPFDSSRKWAASTLKTGETFVTGAPEKMLPFVKKCLDGTGKVHPFATGGFREEIRARAARGERVLLLCMTDRLPLQGFGELTLLCALCFSDPLRRDAREAVRTLQGAGVQIVMVTGDSTETARAIAGACGVLHERGEVLTGEHLQVLDDAALMKILPRLAVVARALPSDKRRLVELAQRMGMVTGMTGDGINDAPALGRADVGFAMGSGTQVAREAGDVAILDDKLSSVSRAVLYGRTVFKSIRKFITLQLIMNFCAVGISILGPFIGVDSPVTVVQMLWINLIMDTLGGLAFAGEAPMAHYMKEPPMRREEQILTRALGARIAVLSLFTVGLSVFFLKSPWVRGFYRESEGDLCLLTAFFALFIFASVLNCFNARTDRVRMLKGLWKNPAFLLIMAAVACAQTAFVYLGGAVLRTMPLLPRELLFTLLLSLAVIPVGWLHLLHRRLCGKKGLY